MDCREDIQDVWGKGGVLLARIIPAGYDQDGINFVTGPEMSQQLGILQHPKGHKIQPHVHNYSPRQVEYTQEVLFLKKGRLAVDFYNEDKTFAATRMMEAGDILILLKGGHGFEVMDDCQIAESKNGPYVSESVDKTRFDRID